MEVQHRSLVDDRNTKRYSDEDASALAEFEFARSPCLCANCIAGSRNSDGSGRKASIRELKTCNATAAPCEANGKNSQKSVTPPA